MACDRDFGIIEKVKRKIPQMFIPERWANVIQLSCKKFNAFSKCVCPIKNIGFPMWNVDKMFQTNLNLQKLTINKLKWDNLQALLDSPFYTTVSTTIFLMKQNGELIIWEKRQYFYAYLLIVRFSGNLL